MKKLSRRSIFPPVVVFVLFFLVAGGIYYKRYPKFTYVLSTSKPKDTSEKPLTYSVNPETIAFSIRLLGRVGEYDRVKLRIRPHFKSSWPFIDFNDELLVQLIDTDGKSKQSQILYSLSGTIKDLYKQEYKLRIEDQYKNLLDEKKVELLPADFGKNWKYCEGAEDCVSVGCTCDCVGCGGFSYQDVVNAEFEADWYDNAQCAKPDICPEVCCSPRKILCTENICQVVELLEDDELKD
jgi:hypothetical protein